MYAYIKLELNKQFSTREPTASSNDGTEAPLLSNSHVSSFGLFITRHSYYNIPYKTHPIIIVLMTNDDNKAEQDQTKKKDQSFIRTNKWFPW